MNNEEKSKEDIVNTNNSLWSYFNTMGHECVKEVTSWVGNHSAKNFVLTVFELDNTAPLIFTYGEELTTRCVDGIDNILKNELTDSYIRRMGIDRFLTVTHSITSDKEYNTKIDKIFSSVKSYGIKVIETPIYLSLIAGSVFFKKENPLSIVLDKVHMAIFDLRENKINNHVIFNESSANLVNYKVQTEMASYLWNSIENNKLRLAFQPIVNGFNGKIKSYEVLLRILTKDNSLISAGPFIQVAERFSFIDIIDIFTLKFAINELKKNENLMLGVNVSNQTICSPKWLKLFNSLSGKKDVASRLILEITETGMEKNLDKINAFIETVKASGCKIAIDDFGSGYTSFKQLKLINTDIIKIDGIFIRVEDYDSRLFVKTLIEFSRAYNIKTVAEFVENEQIANLLVELGIDYMQGYYFGEPYYYPPWKDNNTKMKNYE
jgi:EAL domain-containing protein (putative c-di-GMP-specific phosphodiesterase class I)/GGDEF domain-containing protein